MMDKQAKANILGKIFYCLWMAWVFGIEDMAYNFAKQSEKYDGLIEKRNEEEKIYNDATYAIWRRALGKARMTVLNKRIPSDIESLQSQKKLTDYGA